MDRLFEDMLSVGKDDWMGLHSMGEMWTPAVEEEKTTEDKDQNYYHSEFHYGKFERVIPLLMAIKTDAIKSDFQKGVLTLTLPKAEDTPKKSVKVKLPES